MFVYFSKNGEIDNNITEIKLICMPGVRPVIIPKKIPNTIAMIVCKNIVKGARGGNFTHAHSLTKDYHQNEYVLILLLVPFYCVQWYVNC